MIFTQMNMCIVVMYFELSSKRHQIKSPRLGSVSIYKLTN